MPFETFEHTADLGLRITAATLPELYVESGLAFFSLIVENLKTINPTEKLHFQIGRETDCPEEEWRDNLLVDWLGELLFSFETEHRLFSKFEAKLTDQGLEIDAWGETVDPMRHDLELDIKAVTYHGLYVREVDGQFEAEVIIDL